jgi:hypothetical protein
LNQVKASEDIQEMKKYGLNFEISPVLISVEKLPKVDSLLEDYKTYITTYYSQINSISFLDSYEFAKLDKANVIAWAYEQYKVKFGHLIISK